MKITIISGTNRAGSNTLRLATWVRGAYTEAGHDVTLLDLQQLPQGIFHPGAYAAKPAGFAPFADAVTGADGLVVVTPEYNGSLPGALKLFIDMLPFPVAFERRPVCFVGVAAGRWGALRPVEQLQQIFGYRNGFLFPDRVFVPGVGDALADDGSIKPSFAADLLDKQIRDFPEFCQRLAPMAANAMNKDT